MKYDVLCLLFIYNLTAWVEKSNGLNYVLVSGTASANPTNRSLIKINANYSKNIMEWPPE